ncbi:MAG: prepilin peptidase [Burkholderiaceae bacterium]|nr:prepilin peptidase [Burkholderiaceae bacterium]
MLIPESLSPSWLVWMVVTPAIAVLALKPLAMIGRQSILHWISEETATRLNRISAGWWLLSAIVSLLLLSVTLPAATADHPAAILGGACLTGVLAALLISLTRFDRLCRLLPDPLTGLLAATGLLAYSLDLPVGLGLEDRLLGCLLGYGLLWLIAFLFERFKGIEAMGRGDFAMSAGIGAWLGWQSLPMIWLIASVSAILLTALLYLWGRIGLRPGRADIVHSPQPFLSAQIPFGPALALGAVVTWVQLG